MHYNFKKVMIIEVFLFICCMSGITSGYKILGLFPYYGRSHIKVYEEIVKELALRGHTVHVLSHYPLETPLANYTDLSLKGSVPLDNNNLDFTIFDALSSYSFGVNELLGLYFTIPLHENVMNSEAAQKLLRSEETYDLILTESFSIDFTLGFVHKFKAPFIFLSSCSPPVWTNQFFRNPFNPSYIPHFQSSYYDKMTFFERIKNTIEVNVSIFLWNFLYLPTNEKIMRQHFGDDVPPIPEIAKNASLLLTNTHFTVTGAKPVVPGMVEIGGAHIEPVKKLPLDIEQFIANSPHGVIYFCMGSLLRGATWPTEKKAAFLNAFSQLKERVLWKFEDETATHSKNIMIKKWMPQRDVLAHPKVKLFISHGGLLGTMEAVSAGKPILVTPIFGDQKMNARFLESRGVGKYLKFKNIDNQTVLDLIREVLKPEFSENAKQFSKEFHDRPMSPMDTAIFWIEHVIRHKGAKHLRSAAVDLPFYKYLLFDVYVFILVTIILVLLLLKKCVQTIIKKLSNNEHGKEKTLLNYKKYIMKSL